MADDPKAAAAPAAAPADQRKYCPACKEYVRPAISTFGADTFYSCPKCHGSVVDPEFGPGGKEAAGRVSLDSGRTRMARALIAHGNELHREVLHNQFKDNNVARETEVVETGEELVSRFAQMQESGKLPDLILLDLNTPIIPGASAALAVRAMEESTGSPSRAPIIFVAVEPPKDIEEIKTLCKPAFFMDMGAKETSGTFSERLLHMIDMALT